MKTTGKLFIAMSIAFGLSLSSAYAANTTETAPKVEAVNGGTLVYTGTIGQYGVEFTYTNLHMSPDEPFFSYRYTTVNTNNGKSIDLKYSGEKNGYAIWKEYIKGKNTGTFYIQRTTNSITGTFVNSKGQKFNVNAKKVESESNWADE